MLPSVDVRVVVIQYVALGGGTYCCMHNYAVRYEYSATVGIYRSSSGIAGYQRPRRSVQPCDPKLPLVSRSASYIYISSTYMYFEYTQACSRPNIIVRIHTDQATAVSCLLEWYHMFYQLCFTTVRTSIVLYYSVRLC